MGFKAVYQCLRDLFPQIDARVLRVVALEHSKDADAAVDDVLMEVIPYMSGRTISHAVSPEDRSPKTSSEGVEQEKERDQLRHRQVVERAGAKSSPEPISISVANRNDALHANPTHIDEDLGQSSGSNFLSGNNSNNQSCGNMKSKQLISAGNSEENTGQVGLDCIAPVISNDSEHEGENNNREQLHKNAESSQLIASRSTENFDLEVGAGLLSSVMVAPTPTHENSVNDSLNYSKDSYSSAVDMVEHSEAQLDVLSLQNQIPVAPECNLQLEYQFKKQRGSDSSDITSNQDCTVNEVSDVENESTENSVVTRSDQLCNVDILEEIIEDAKNNKKTLFSAMESVINMMREVELKEKAAEQAQAEVARGGLDIFVKVEELKQILANAKEANDVHAGEVYGEKAILATEVRELQSRILNLSDERDRSLSTLDEMRQTLEGRLAAAEELRKAAEQEKLQMEVHARKPLSEQEAIMEKVVQESKLLEQEAEENSKLREFLINRGCVVDTLQGEISVICQDVRELKDKFDERVPLSKSFSSSQASCILASSGSLKSTASDSAFSGSSMKDVASDRDPEQLNLHLVLRL